MAPPNKKNGFLLFVNRWHCKHPEMTFPQAVSHCGAIWEKMSAKEREPYGLKKPEKKLSESDQAQLELIEQEQQMKRTIEGIVMEGKKSQDLENTKFLFCAFNYFTKDPDGALYVPAEFAACSYSLKEGIISVFSTLIDPGKLNLGLGREALDHSTSTHNLPLPPKALGESNLLKLHRQMVGYLAKYNDRGPAIVFTTKDMRPIVKSCFRFLARKGKQDFLTRIMVFDIQYLIFVLKKEVLEMANLPNDKLNIHITDAFFLKDFFEFTNDIACEFHEENDRSKYCAQSMVMRWAFTFSDYMCGDLGIAIEPGRHVPSTVKPSYRIHNADTSESFHSISTFGSLRIDEGRRLRKDISAISTRYTSASCLEEMEENEKQGIRHLDVSEAISSITSGRSSPCGTTDQKRSSKSKEYPLQSGYIRNSSIYSQRRSLLEVPSDISTVTSGRSSPYVDKGQKGASKIKEYPRQEGHIRYPSVNSQRRSLRDVPSEMICSRCSCAFSSTNERGSSSNIEEYRRSFSSTNQRDFSPNIEEYRLKGGNRNPSANSQRRSPQEFPDDISSISSRRSYVINPYGVADEKDYSSNAEEYPNQGERRRQDRKYSPERQEPEVYTRRFFKNLSDDSFEWEN